MEARKYKVVVGIDFGSSGMGYAYSFNDEKNIVLGKLTDSGADVKVPTEIIIDDQDNNKVLALGEKCSLFLSQHESKGYYFKRIKMSLYAGQKEIYAVNKENTKFELKKVISMVLKELKENAKKEILGHQPNLKDEEIKWVLTVPAIWSMDSKRIMIDAAIDAGLISASTDMSCFLALEPEAASLYCLNSNAIETKYMEKGCEYIVCDLGGGTGDIVAHSIGENKELKESTKAEGGPLGSDEIDKRILKEVVGYIFGVTNTQELMKLNKEKDSPYEEPDLCGEWLNIERDIKNFKVSISQDIVVNKGKYKIKFSCFKDLCEDDVIVKKIQEFNSLCKDGWQLELKNKKNFILSFPYQMIYDMMIEQGNLIVKEIKKITDVRPNISNLIFVGGYSSCDIMTDFIKQKFSSLKAFKPENPGIAILKGAVIFGIRPTQIKTRKAVYTIGDATNLPWDEKRHGKAGGKKVKSSKGDKWLCDDCFNAYIICGQDVDTDQKITQEFNMQNPRYCTIKFYRSLNKDPVLINQKGVEYIGKFRLDSGKEFPKEQRKIRITLNFGGTFIDVKAIHIASGSEISSRLTVD